MWSHSPSLAPEEANGTWLGGRTGSGSGVATSQPKDISCLGQLAGRLQGKSEERLACFWLNEISRHVEMGMESVRVRRGAE